MGRIRKTAMLNTNIVVTDKITIRGKIDLFVYIVSGDGKKSPTCAREIKTLVGGLYKLGDFAGKKEEVHIMYPDHGPTPSSQAPRRIALVGIGPLKKGSSVADTREMYRIAGGTIAKVASKVKAATVRILLPDLSRKLYGGAEPIVEGVLLGDYRFTKYKTKPEPKGFHGIKKLFIQTARGSREGSREVRKIVRRAKSTALAAKAARDMANEPGNVWTPQKFSEYARSLAGSTGLKCKVLEKAHLEKLGMGGILAVNQGSSTRPKLVLLEHNPAQFSKTILLVGKGITFDSGGISLKPAAGMQDMKYDMCGGAAVLGAMQAIAQEKPDVRVIGVVPSTDNMPGSSAVKPGDIITHYNGVTSEVVNTDAEGRLILADALAYGIEKYTPTCVIDLATLTGAVIIGLGHHHTGMLSNNDELAKKIMDAGSMSGEPIWRLPLDKEYSKQIDSEVADIKNVGGKAAGTITAAAYLEKFVGKTPWVHLDIAGTAWEFTKKSYVPDGPSGIGVRTLIEFVRNWQ